MLYAVLRVLPTVLLFVCLVLCVGFFTSSETAYLSLPRLKLRTMLDEKKKNAETVKKLKDNMDRLLTTVLIGTNFLNSLTASLATALFLRFFSEKYIAFAPFATAFVITTFGQIVPKTAAGLYPEKFTSFSAVPLLIFEKIIFPIVWIFERLSHFAVHAVEKIVKPVDYIVTEEELKALIAVGENEGTIEKNESRMMNKIIEFNDLLVSDIMRHRSFLSMVPDTASYQLVLDEFQRSGVSTMVVYHETKENVVGILNYKKLLYASEDEDFSDGYASRVMNHSFYVPGTLTILELLNKFRTSEYKFAVVLNEQGETYGVVTMNDILRTVFGHIHGEEYFLEIPPEEKIQLLSANTFLVPGDIKLEDVNEILGLNLHSEEMNTLGGFLLEKIGYLPAPGEVSVIDRNLFIVEEIFQRRITSVKITKN